MYFPVGATPTTNEANAIRAAVMSAAQTGGLARAYAKGGEDRVDILAELIAGAIHIGNRNAGVAIARQASAADRLALLGSSQFRQSLISRGWGAYWHTVVDVLNTAQGVAGGAAAPGGGGSIPVVPLVLAGGALLAFALWRR